MAFGVRKSPPSERKVWLMRWLVGLFLTTHGLMHLAVWLPSLQPGAPFDAGHSWLLSAIGSGNSARAIAMILAVTAALGLVVGGMGWLAGGAWAKSAVIWSAWVSLGLVRAYFHPWFIPVTLSNAAILYLFLRR